jgi:hypothetical protein
VRVWTHSQECSALFGVLGNVSVASCQNYQFIAGLANTGLALMEGILWLELNFHADASVFSLLSFIQKWKQACKITRMSVFSVNNFRTGRRIFMKFFRRVLPFKSTSTVDPLNIHSHNALWNISLCIWMDVVQRSCICYEFSANDRLCLSQSSRVQQQCQFLPAYS